MKSRACGFQDPEETIILTGEDKVKTKEVEVRLMPLDLEGLAGPAATEEWSRVLEKCTLCGQSPVPTTKHVERWVGKSLQDASHGKGWLQESAPDYPKELFTRKVNFTGS